MKILISIPRTLVISAGPAYVAACLRQAGYEVTGHTFTDAAELARLVPAYDIVMTGGLSCHWDQIKTILDTARHLGKTTVLGGGIVTAEPEIVTRALNPTYAVLGQGEITAVELVAYIERKQAALPNGVALLRLGCYIQTAPRADVKDLDSLPFPAYDLWNLGARMDHQRPSDINYLSFLDSPREYPLITSRSCPFHCSFCFHTSGNAYRRRSVANVMLEIRMAVERYNINFISILDELFGSSNAWLKDFCEQFMAYQREIGRRIVWWTSLRVPGVNKETLQLLKDSGCILICYGFESYSETVLKSMRKRIAPQEIDHAYKLTREVGISVRGDMIFGDPAETSETAAESIAYWKLHPDMWMGMVWTFPGTAMYALAKQRGLIKDLAAYQGQKWGRRLLNLTAMSDDEFGRLAMRLFKLDFTGTLWPKTHRSGETVWTTCPHCRQESKYHRFILPLIGKKQVVCRRCLGRFVISSPLYRFVSRLLVRFIPERAWPALFSIN